jgi:uncharacterized damage-inducible protein DinB
MSAMSQTAVTFEELLGDFEATTARWKQFFTTHPEAAKVDTDIAGTKSIEGLVCHIYVASIRTTERLLGEPFSEPGSTDTLAAAWALEARATTNLRRFFHSATDGTYDEILRFQTRAGEIAASRRKLCLHIFVHAIRHWAQIGTIVRQHGYPPGWMQDILGSEAIR